MLLPKTPRVTPAGLLRDIEDEDDVQATGQPTEHLPLSPSLSLSLLACKAWAKGGSPQPCAQRDPVVHVLSEGENGVE